MTITLCSIDGCLLKSGHTGKHNKYPQFVWESLFKNNEQDSKKVNKAGYATPRGGDKGAYQNHVYRNNKVIIPYEKLNQVTLDNYDDNYVIRLFPNQYFESSGVIKQEFIVSGCNVKVGINAFILYRTHKSFELFPPLSDWQIRYIEKDGTVINRRSKLVTDLGHYVLRLSAIGQYKKRYEGPPQGIFAPEYANEKTNYFSKAFLAWLIIRTQGSPHIDKNIEHLTAILNENDLIDVEILEKNIILKNGLTCCPLCGEVINYNELHDMVSFDGALGLANSQNQVAGSTRSTAVNLFHMHPLVYESLEHKPDQLAWGHAICNTKLGQRECIPFSDLEVFGKPIGYIDENSDFKQLAFISTDNEFIRTEDNQVWVKITHSKFVEDNEDVLIENEEVDIINSEIVDIPNTGDIQ